jgi:hypothetical protein
MSRAFGGHAVVHDVHPAIEIVGGVVEVGGIIIAPILFIIGLVCYCRA